MSEKTLVEFSKGEMELDVAVKDGKLRFSVAYDGKGADAGLYIDVESGYFLDKLAQAIPGQLDDLVIAALKSALS